MKAATNLLILFLLGRVTKSKLQSGSYVRQAYGVGQELKEKNNYPGSGTLYLLDKNYKDILSSTESLGGERPTKLNAASLTGIWAENNTRVSLFVVLKRKECFGTSGNRIKVHLFAGWDYKENLIRQTDWVDKSNSTGVPMEGNLTPFENQKKTKFIVQAIKDPHAGNLDCIQIIKDSTKNGKRTEQEFNTVWSGNRKKSSIGKRIKSSKGLIKICLSSRYKICSTFWCTSVQNGRFS